MLSYPLNPSPLTSPSALPPFHHMQNSRKGLRSATRSIPMGKFSVPEVIVGLDDDTAVVSFYGLCPLEKWDLAAGKFVRKFSGSGQHCYSMANLPGGRIAAGWHNGSQWVVTVFGTGTGWPLQELTGFGAPIFGLALVEDHLLTMCGDKTLRVWSRDKDASGLVRCQCVCPRGKESEGRTNARCECV